MVDPTGVRGTGISSARKFRDVLALLICDTARRSRTTVGNCAAGDQWITDTHAFVEGERPVVG